MGYLAILALKQVNEIQREVLEANSVPSHVFGPSNQERYLRIDDTILKMDFLPSTAADANKVILLLLVANNDNTSLLLYRWDSREGPRYARPMMCSGQRLRIEDSLPLILIPSSTCQSFIIVVETHIAVYDNVISRRAKHISFPNQREVPSQHDNSSVSPPWVHWAKPKRHAKYLETHDDFYLVREDGELRYFNVTYGSPMKVNSHFCPGNIDVSVDQAFAMLSPPVGLGAEVFVAGGDVSDGGVWHCEPRKTPFRVQTLPSMARTRDMLITSVPQRLGSRPTQGPQDAQRFFACSGKDSKNSYVNEIRLGLQAQIGVSIENGDASGVTHLWILEDKRPDRILFLMSHPLYSSILSIEPTNLDIDSGDINSYPGMDLESPTLAAACTPEGLTIQLTRDSVNICVLSQGPRRARLPHLAATCAAIEASTGSFVIACRSPQGSYLQMGVTNMMMEILLGGQQYDLPEEPAALSVVLLGAVHVVLAGLSDGTLLLLCADSSTNLHLLSSHSIQSFLPDAHSCAISSVEVLSGQNANEGLILCGLRTGLLVLLSMKQDLNTSNAEINVNFVNKMEFGSTRVSIVGEQGPTSIQRGALISCESDLRRISLLDAVGLQYHVSRIWFTDPNDVSASQPMLSAVSRNIAHPIVDIKGLLVCASETGIVISSLTLHDAAVPRRQKIIGTPAKLAYSKYLQKLLVGINRVEITPRRKSGSKQSVNQLFLPHLELVDPDEEQLSKNGPDRTTLLKIGESGDRIRALTEWRPADETANFPLLAIGIDSIARAHTLRSGRLLIVNVAKKAPFSSLKVGVGNRYPGRPVFSLHTHGLSSIVVGAGNDVLLENFDMKTRRLSTLATYSLPSSSTSLYASGSLVYAATSRHSLFVLRKDGDKFENLASDNIARDIKSILMFDNDVNLLNTATEMGTCLVGISRAGPERQEQVLFDARLPLVLQGIQRRGNSTDSRHIFDGISADGTICRFKSLQYSEWKLLKFLEDFFRDDLLSGLRPLNPLMKRRKDSPPSALEMHINGNLLALLIDSGPSMLRAVLARGKFGHVPRNPVVKTEEQKARAAEFTKLANAVVGEAEDLVVDVVMWLRGLMRATT